LKGKWYVYIIKTVKGKLYTGITTSPVRRFAEHARDPKKKAKFFRSDSPLEILLLVNKDSRSSATKFEIEIKKMTRKKKLELIKSTKSINLNELPQK